ncbi:hypothetical protein JOB18_038541 [Solea senegalensis]|uniref:Uncharacterized protein n=1 Tax=Solea senegalensis TaxID=28829 RepID=A0AAV6QNT1_SOLSE|nr:hypothetical protein JOB18_038541 [Solea senegalensis]
MSSMNVGRIVSSLKQRVQYLKGNRLSGRKDNMPQALAQVVEAHPEFREENRVQTSCLLPSLNLEKR